MDPTTDAIKADIDATREAMTDKLGQIEDRVKDSVDDTVSTVKETFDVRHQVAVRPWAALGASVMTGFVVGQLTGSPQVRQGARQMADRAEERWEGVQAAMSRENGKHAAYAPVAPRQPGLLDQMVGQLTDQLGDELQVLEAAAVSAIVGLARDWLQTAVPQFGEEFQRARQERARGSSTGRPTESQPPSPSAAGMAAAGGA